MFGPSLDSLAPEAQLLVGEVNALPDKYPGFQNIPKDIVYMLGCRLFWQMCGTYRALLNPRLFCPFCNLHWVKKKPIARAGGWLAKENDIPYGDQHEHHFVLFPERHIVDPDNLGVGDAMDRFSLERDLRHRFNLSGYALVSRTGDPRRHVGTVPHIHSLLQVPTGNAEARSIFAKSEVHHREDYARLKGHLALIESRGGLQWLLDPDVVPE